MKVSHKQLERLRHLHLLGIYYRDQMEAMVTECREILSGDADEDTGFCEDIVFRGTAPEQIVRRLTDLPTRARQESA